MIKHLLSIIYLSGSWLHKWVYRIGLFKSYQSQTPVIGIGNIEVGGTGKTSTIVDLAQRYLDKNLSPVVVVRGYRKTSHSTFYVHHCQNQVDRLTLVQELGDEGAYIAQVLQGQPCFVIAARKKWKGVAWADRAFAADVILVDDALQHYALKVHRQLIMATHPDAIYKGKILPAGRLRERVPTLHSSLVRWVWTQRDLKLESEKNETSWHRIVQGVVLLKDDHSSVESQPVSFLSGRKVNLLTAIGNASRFEHDCKDLGVDVVWSKHLKDHQSFTKHLCHQLQQEADPDADWLVTPKDAIKLQSQWFKPQKVWVIQYQLKWNDRFATSLWPWLSQDIKVTA